MPINPFLWGNSAGVGQQTAVGQAVLMGHTQQRAAAPRRRRRKSAVRSAAASPARRRKGKAKRARMVKGSAAAKAYMAKIRRKRRR